MAALANYIDNTKRILTTLTEHDGNSKTVFILRHLLYLAEAVQKELTEQDKGEQYANNK